MNLENMNTLISEIEKVSPRLCIMSRWRQRGDCGTAFCIAGWTSALVEQKIIPEVEFDADWDESLYVAEMRAVLDISRIDADALALIKNDPNIDLVRFDQFPASVRKAAMLNVLRVYRDTGAVNWRSAIAEARRSAKI